MDWCIRQNLGVGTCLFQHKAVVVHIPGTQAVVVEPCTGKLGMSGSWKLGKMECTTR